MGEIIPLRPKPSAKLGFKRARRRRSRDEKMEGMGQLNLFAGESPQRGIRRVVPLSSMERKGLGTFELALLMDDRGEAGAAEKYRQAVAEGDYPADALCNLGILESSSGDKAKAFDCFTRALRLQPRHFEAHYNLANLYFDTGNFLLAQNHYEFAREIDPSYANLYYNLGLVLAMEKHYDAAVRNFNHYAEVVGGEEAERTMELVSRILGSAAKDGT